MSAGGPAVLVIGRSGQVAHELGRVPWPPGVAAACYGRPAIDLARPTETIAYIVGAAPRLVVNAAAYTAVDDAERERDLAFAINRDGAAAVAEACARIGAALIHLSTDYVFDGAKAGAYREDDPIHPLSVYGASKAAGEAAVRERLDRAVILRTSWVYAPIGRNFVRTMLRLGAARDRIGVVDDQRGCPTSAADIARAIATIAQALLTGHVDGFGTFHFCGGGDTTWYGFARAIFAGAAARGLKTPPTVTPIATADYPTPALRPRNSVLDCGRIGRIHHIVPRPWPAALAECLDEIAATIAAD